MSTHIYIKTNKQTSSHVDEDDVVGLEVGHAEEDLIGSDVVDEKAGAVLERHGVGHADAVVAWHSHALLPDAAGREHDDAVVDLEVGHVRAALFDEAARLVAGRVGRLRRRLVEALTLHELGEVEAGRLHAHYHPVAVGRRRIVLVLERDVRVVAAAARGREHERLDLLLAIDRGGRIVGVRHFRALFACLCLLAFLFDVYFWTKKVVI